MTADRSRRGLLVGLAGLAVGAGCSTAEDSTSPTPADDDELPNAVESPATRSVRNPRGEPAVRSSAVTPGTRDGTWVPTEWLVSSAKERQLLRFGPAADGIEAARAFLEATDFATASILVVQRSIPACRARTVRELRWDEGAVGFRWAVTDRADGCDGDTPVDVEALFVRVPAPLRELGTFRSSRV